MALFTVYSRAGGERRKKRLKTLLAYQSEISTFMKHTFTEPLSHCQMSCSRLETVENQTRILTLNLQGPWEGANEANQKTAFSGKSIGATSRE